MALSDLEQAIEQAITAIRLGDKARGLELLAQITQIEPMCEEAWIWLAFAVVYDLELKKFCLQWILEEINPYNSQAEEWIKQLQNMQLPVKPFGDPQYTILPNGEFRKAPPQKVYISLAAEAQKARRLLHQYQTPAISANFQTITSNNRIKRSNDYNKYLWYAVGDVIFGLWVYIGVNAGDPDVKLWAFLSLAAYGSWMYAKSGVTRSIFKQIRGTGLIGAILTLILLGAFGPIIHFVGSLIKYLSTLAND